MAKRTSPEQRNAVLLEWAQAGGSYASLVEVAGRHGFAPSTVRYWARRQTNVAALKADVALLRGEKAQLADEVDELRAEVEALRQRLADVTEQALTAEQEGRRWRVLAGRYQQDPALAVEAARIADEELGETA